MLDSLIASESYSIRYDQVETPTMNLVGGTYNIDQSVTITCTTPEAIIRYSTDGSDPDGSSLVYTGPVLVAGDGTVMTIKTYAAKDGMCDSVIKSETYSILYGSWTLVGNAGFSAGHSGYTSLHVYDNMPYVAYMDNGNSGKATVMTYNGSSWVAVESAGFTDGYAMYISLYVYNGTPYIAYADGACGDKQTVMKYE
jgi:hypothetical protein